MTPGAAGHVPWCGHVSHIVKIHYFFSTLEDGSDKHKKAVLMIHVCTLIPIVYKNRLFCSFPLPLLIFYLFYDGAVDRLI